MRNKISSFIGEWHDVIIIIIIGYAVMTAIEATL